MILCTRCLEQMPYRCGAQCVLQVLLYVGPSIKVVWKIFAIFDTPLVHNPEQFRIYFCVIMWKKY